MTNPSLTPAQATQFIQALLKAMLQHGVGFIQASPAGGQLGLTAAEKFVTQDLTFGFLSPAEHQSAAQAYELPSDQLILKTAPRTEEDMQTFIRAAGLVFDTYRVHTLTFGSAGYLGFRASGTTREFVLEDLQVQGEALNFQ